LPKNIYQAPPPIMITPRLIKTMNIRAMNNHCTGPLLSGGSAGWRGGKGLQAGQIQSSCIHTRLVTTTARNMSTA